ncbi:bifunctional diguanylate cyclase/phosphodiesterase [Arsukibacterium sp.]|uniref:bifunctional diguanylate cyclase/phosphodiesterase n=1 Tax=Arsukibacterium sp. TaxID=1977258 RepID=UPI002FDA71B4
MNDATYSTPTGMNSLGLKFSVVVFLAMFIAGSLVAYVALWLQQSVQLSQQHQAIERTTQNYVQHFDSFLQQKELAAIAANQVVSRALQNGVTSASANLPRSADGSVRQHDDFSAAFIPASNYNRRTAALMQNTAALWQHLSPLMLQHDFFNFYFISTDQFVRTTPADWALALTADFNVDALPSFKLAGPERNPVRLPKWTPVYYDELWQRWLVTLVVPVYVNNEFIGITGSDFELGKLLATTFNAHDWSPHNRLVVFDQEGQILQLPSRRNAPPARQDAAQSQPYGALAIQQYAKQLANTPRQQQDQLAQPDDFLVSALPIPKLKWYGLVYTEKSQVLDGLSQFRSKLISFYLVMAILIAVLLQVFSYQFFLKRINRLAGAVHRLSRGDIAPVPLDDNKDEIGMLNRAFTGMSREIADLVTGLNAKISEKEQAERSARKLSKAVSFSSSGIVITDQYLQIEYLNPFILDMIAGDEQSLVSTLLINLFAEEMQQVGTNIVQTLNERQHWRGDMLLQHQQQSQHQIWVSLAIAPIRDDKGTVTNYVCAMQDISFIKQSQKQMEQLAYYDVLTGLANRSYFRDQLRKSIAMSHRGYYNFALLYFDLDEFKRINDTLGHDAGDELLKEVARRLTSRLREEDTIARLGGDEFAVILSGIKDRHQASQIAQNLQQAFHAPVKLGTHDVSISASIGITVAPEDASEEELLLKHADLAMYEAKARGKNTFHFFSQDLNDAANERLQIENLLREAIREQQFLLYYQPKLDIRSNTIIGYETLIRWLRPDNTLIPPQRFIPVAESTGLIVQIGEWIILEACRFLARQHSRGYAVTLAINLSVRQFTDQDLPKTVDRIVKRTGVDPAFLIFEITESMLMGDTDAAVNQLNQLKRLGVTLSIDDFGTGYSSLSYLKRFPVDELKIDRSFVKDIPDDQNDMDIVAAIIAMAQKMNMRVVAEGVETAAQLEFLKKNACDQVQGYYFSMPLAEQELSRLNFTINT